VAAWLRWVLPDQQSDSGDAEQIGTH